MNDESILQGLKNGSESCLIEVVEQYKKKVVSLCYSYTQDYHEAEDLSQEVFLSFYKNVDNFRAECSISTYIYKITLSKCIDYKRKKGIKSFLTGLFSYQGQSEKDIDDKYYIRQCIISLPDELKQVITLYYYIGLSQKEISCILNVPVKTVEGRIYRAKQKLKLKLEKEGLVECSKSGTI